MSTYLQSYRVGTLSVANGSTSVTGTTTLWLANVLAGDLIIVGSTLAEVASVESNTALTLVSGWTGTTVTGSAYVIHRWSRGWLQAGTTALLLADYVSRIPTFIPTTGAPSDAVGSPGNIAVDTSANVFYVKGATTWGSAVSMVGPAGELTRLDAVAGGDLAAWTGTNSAQVRKATAAEVRTAAGGVRETLTAARTYYVRPDGNNSNDGLTNSAGGAKLTIAGALAAAYKIDANGFNVTINIAAGTWAENIAVSSVIPGLNVLYFVGAGENVTIVGAGAATALLVSVPIRYQVQNLTLGAASGGNSVGLWGRYGSVGYLIGGNVGFNALSARAIGLDAGAYVEATSGEIRLRGSTPFVIYVGDSASATLTAGCTVKTMVPITCSGGFASVFTASATIVPTFDLTAGAVTGPRYSVRKCGALSVNGAGVNFLPGSTAGTVDAVSYYG